MSRRWKTESLLEKELLGFFLSGHPVDTLGGLGKGLDTLKPKNWMNYKAGDLFRLCGVLSDVERRYTKKDAKPWARFNLMCKERISSLPMFTEAYEKFGVQLEEGKIVVVEGVASHRDGETRMTESSYAVENALVQLVEEVTWLIDPNDADAESFVRDLHIAGDKGLGNTLIRLGFAEER